MGKKVCCHEKKYVVMGIIMLSSSNFFHGWSMYFYIRIVCILLEENKKIKVKKFPPEKLKIPPGDKTPCLKKVAEWKKSPGRKLFSPRNYIYSLFVTLK